MERLLDTLLVRKTASIRCPRNDLQYTGYAFLELIFHHQTPELRLC